MNDGYYYSDFNGHGPAYMNRSGGFNMMCNNNNNVSLQLIFEIEKIW